ncbi:MAG: cupin domain-containing protein [Alphaproteobacteria bacterium]|nr:cupin domain-containing protein [Alphaproteobacteria bacterium]
MHDHMPATEPERLDNPATGERADIETSALRGAACTSIRFTLPGGADGAPPHRHQSYEETFAVLDGVLELRQGADLAPRLLRAGECVTIKRGQWHAFRNAAAAPVTFRTVVAGGAGFEKFIRAWYGLGRDGPFARGAPSNPLHLALALDAGDITLMGPPPALQRIVRRALARLARASGADVAVTQHWGAAHV